MRRLIAAVVIAGGLTYAANPPAAPSISDGRYYPCGVITEHGVTEHLDAYRERCGVRIP